LLNAEYHYNAPTTQIGDAVSSSSGAWWVVGVYDFLEDDVADEGEVSSKLITACVWGALFGAWLTGGMAAAVALMCDDNYPRSMARKALVMFATWERAAEAPDEEPREFAAHAERRIAAMLPAKPLPERA
jgi:hypothetical protein